MTAWRKRRHRRHLRWRRRSDDWVRHFSPRQKRSSAPELYSRRNRRLRSVGGTPAGAGAPEAAGPRVRRDEALLCTSLTTPMTSKMAGQVLPKSDARNAVEQEQHAQSDQDRRPHEPAGAAVFALAHRPVRPQQAPVFGEQPHAENRSESAASNDRRPNSKTRCVIRNSTPNPISTAAPAGILVLSVERFSPACASKGLKPGPKGSGAGSPS